MALVRMLQLDLAWQDRTANHAQMERMLCDEPISPGELIVLPEMCASGFTMDLDAAAEDAALPTTSLIKRLARENAVTIVAGTVRRPDHLGRNQAIVAGPDGKIIAEYTKIHPFTFAGEDAKYAPGNEVVSFQWQDAIVTPMICYDLRFPEIFRKAVKNFGTEIFVVIANWPTRRVTHWYSLLIARAIENQAYVIGVNRCGKDPTLEYPGRSMIVSPKGEVIADAGEKAGMIKTPLDLDDLREYRKTFPALRDMRFVE